MDDDSRDHLHRRRGHDGLAFMPQFAFSRGTEQAMLISLTEPSYASAIDGWVNQIA
jgi:hypothetical protein